MSCSFEGVQFQHPKKVQKGVVVFAVGLQALVTAAHPQQMALGLQHIAQSPLRVFADVAEQKVGVVHQQQQALAPRLGAVGDGLQVSGGLLSHGQVGNALGFVVQGLGGSQVGAPALQRIRQGIEHVGPELVQGADGVLLFGKTQGQPLCGQLGIVIHRQGQALHQRGFAHAARAHQQHMLPHGVGRGVSQRGQQIGQLVLARHKNGPQLFWAPQMRVVFADGGQATGGRGQRLGRCVGWGAERFRHGCGPTSRAAGTSGTAPGPRR